MSRESKDFYKTCNSIFNSCESVIDNHILAKRRFVPAGPREGDEMRLWTRASECVNAFIDACPELPPVTLAEEGGDEEMDSHVEIIEGPEVTVPTSDI